MEVLFRVWRRAGCDGAMVVWAQCRGLLPDHQFSGHDVLLRAQAGRAAHLLLQTVHRPFLGAGLYLYVGRSASSLVYLAAGLDAVPGNGAIADPAGAVLGRN